VRALRSFSVHSAQMQLSMSQENLDNTFGQENISLQQPLW